MTKLSFLRLSMTKNLEILLDMKRFYFRYRFSMMRLASIVTQVNPRPVND